MKKHVWAAAAVLALPSLAQASTIYRQEASLDVIVSVTSDFLPYLRSTTDYDDDTYCIYEDDDYEPFDCNGGNYNWGHSLFGSGFSLSSTVWAEFDPADYPGAVEASVAAYKDLKGHLYWKNETAALQTAMWRIAYEVILTDTDGMTSWYLGPLHDGSHAGYCAPTDPKALSGIMDCSRELASDESFEVEVYTSNTAYLDWTFVAPLPDVPLPPAVPLPATLPLLLMAFGGFGFWRRSQG